MVQLKRLELMLMEANIHREIVGIVKSITVSIGRAGKCYGSILMDNEVAAPERLNTVR